MPRSLTAGVRLLCGPPLRTSPGRFIVLRYSSGLDERDRISLFHRGR